MGWPVVAVRGPLRRCPGVPVRVGAVGVATVRQLAAKGLRPAGQDVAGWLVWGPANRPRWAYLYRLDLAAPSRVPSPAQLAALARMNTARQVCPTCRRDVGYRIRTSLGECDRCAALARGEQYAQDNNHFETKAA